MPRFILLAPIRCDLVGGEQSEQHASNLNECRWLAVYNAPSNLTHDPRQASSHGAILAPADRSPAHRFRRRQTTKPRLRCNQTLMKNPSTPEPVRINRDNNCMPVCGLLSRQLAVSGAVSRLVPNCPSLLP
jgi:hypothetical protein